MILGTAQFGMPYSLDLKNPKRKVCPQDALKIIALAVKNKFSAIDTGASYGDAENVVGEFNKYSRVNVVTKLDPTIEFEKGKGVYDSIKKQIVQSLTNLNQTRIYGYLLHNPKLIYNNYVVDALLNIKKEGLISKWGVSIYSPEDGLYAAKNVRVDIIQAPYNIFDQRLDKTDFWKIAINNNITVHVRSVFLRGLLFRAPSHLPEDFKSAAPYLDKLREISHRRNLPIVDLCIGFVRSNKDINDIVFGVHTESQLMEDMVSIRDKAFQPVLYETVEELKETFSDLNAPVVIPSIWSQFHK